MLSDDLIKALHQDGLAVAQEDDAPAHQEDPDRLPNRRGRVQRRVADGGQLGERKRKRVCHRTEGPLCCVGLLHLEDDGAGENCRRGEQHKQGREVVSAAIHALSKDGQRGGVPRHPQNADEPH